jgi:hypothetical protein
VQSSILPWCGSANSSAVAMLEVPSVLGLLTQEYAAPHIILTNQILRGAYTMLDDGPRRIHSVGLLRHDMQGNYSYPASAAD